MQKFNNKQKIPLQLDLTSAQKKSLTDYQTKFTEEQRNKIEAMVKKKLDAFDDGGPAKSTPLQKIRLIDASQPKAQKTAILSIWNFDDDHNDSQIAFRENTLLDIRCVTVNGMRGKDLLLTAGRNKTILREVRPLPTSTLPTIVHSAFSRQLTPIAEIDAEQFKPNFNEFDTLGLIVEVENAMSSQHYQSIFVADANKNLLCLKFWNGVRHYAYENIVKVGAIVVICQLDWRPHSRMNFNGLPQAFVSDITTFSENPKSDERIYAMRCLCNELDCIVLKEFIDECVEKTKQNRHAMKENQGSSLECHSNRTTFNRKAPVSSTVTSKHTKT